MRLPDAKTWVRIALVLIAISFVTYMIFIPTVDAIASAFREKPKRTFQSPTEMTFAEQVRLRTIEGMTAFWFFALGASIGSFLNVVVYRMPLGKSLVMTGSRCPTCGTPISGRDNVPILGWLMLGGRCRTCQGSISLRYPTVEIVVGSLFLVLYFVELISGGWNLPIRQRNMYAGVVWIVFYTKWDLVTIYLYHCVMLSMLLTLALIAFDQRRLFKKSLAQFSLLLAIPAIVFPHLLLVKVPAASFGFAMPIWAQASATVIVGCATGLIASLGIAYGFRRWTGREEVHLLPSLSLIGISLGWQAALTTLAISLVLTLGWRGLLQIATKHISQSNDNTELLRVPYEEDALEPSAKISSTTHGRCIPLAMFLFVAAIIHQVFWRWLFIPI
jgi:leader peptidase (prepilin peptidase)/N-methyltransferase